MGSSMAVGSSSTMHSGLHGDDARNGHPLLLSAGEQMGRVLRGKSYIPTALQGLVHPAADLLPGGTPRFSGAKATSSSTTLATIWLSGFWNTMPTVLADVQQSVPRRWYPCRPPDTLPPLGSRMALKCLARVDLPQPLWPSTATKLPRFNVQRDAVQDQRMPRLQHRCRQSSRFPL